MNDEIYYQAIDLLKQLIAIPSISRDEAEASIHLAAYIERCEGVTVTRIGNNVLATPCSFDAALPTILLNSHIDTVKPVAGWTKEPFAATECDDRIYGLGSNDAGASLVSLLHAFITLIARKQPYNLLFLASCEEEVSGKNGIELAIPHLPPIAFAVVGEPTKMHPAIAEKGLMVLDCSVKGKAGHAARNEGVNAIYNALPIVEQLRTFVFPKVSEQLGAVKLSVTQIAAGTQHNVVPDSCTFVVDVRTNDCYSNVEALDYLRSQVQGCDMQPRSTRLNSSHLSPSHPFVQRAVMMGLEPFGSPTLSDQALMPFPSLKIGAGDSARSHTADEYIECFEIREAIELYVKLLDGLQL